MKLTRFLAVVLLCCALFAGVGCQALKDDPILGDHPWQPSGFGMKPEK